MLSNQSSTEAFDQLQLDREETNAKLEELSWWPKITLSYPYTHALTNKNQLSEYLYRFRLDVEHGKITFQQSIDILTEINRELFDNSLSSVKIPCSQSASNLLFAFNLLLRATENAGIMRAMGSTFFAPCFLSKKHRKWIIELDSKKDTYLDISGQYYPPSKQKYNDLVDEAHPLNDTLAEMIGHMTSQEYYPTCQAQTSAERIANSDYWFSNISAYVDLLKKVHDFAALQVIDDVAQVSFT